MNRSERVLKIKRQLNFVNASYLFTHISYLREDLYDNGTRTVYKYQIFLSEFFFSSVMRYRRPIRQRSDARRQFGKQKSRPFYINTSYFCMLWNYQVLFSFELSDSFNLTTISQFRMYILMIRDILTVLVPLAV